MAVRIDKIITNAGSSVAKTVEKCQISKELSRELQMVPKYFECAKSKTSDLYRFNSKQVEQMSQACINYETNLPVTSLVKDLLDIGSTGKAHQLTAEEIKGFFQATSGMKDIEQKNVLKFMKTAAEDVPEKLTPESFRKANPYEDFKRRYMILERDFINRASKQTVEKDIEQRYNALINSELNLMSNKYYAECLTPKKQSCLNYIVKNHRSAVKAVAQSSSPETLYHVFNTAGVTADTVNASEALVKLYKMSNGNKFLIKDISHAFYGDEIKEITSLLQKDAAGKREALQHYYRDIFDSNPDLSYSRKSMIKLLELEKDYTVRPLRYRLVNDVFRGGIGGCRGARILSGNYEGGKKR